MAILDTFSKRKRTQARAGKPDVYQYDDLPVEFRRQVIHLWIDAIGFPLPRDMYTREDEYLWPTVNRALAKEYGLFQLGKEGRDDFVQCQEFFLNASTDQALDVIEYTARIIDRVARRYDPGERMGARVKQDADDALHELNERFREHRIGYQYVSGQIIRVDSQFVHEEVVRPALALLSEERFKGAEDEFLSAHAHYRAGRHKEAIADALKAFESTMKTICERKRWPYAKTAQAKDLVGVLFSNALIPDYLANHFSGFRAALEGGVPTVRNKTSGHGQGETVLPVPDYLAAYAIHLAASNIVMLLEAFRASR